MKEVGDFIAHRDVREQGPSHRRSRALVEAVELQVATQRGEATTDQRLSVLKHSLDVISLGDIARDIGFDLKTEVLDSMVGRILAKRLGERGRLTERESKLLSAMEVAAPTQVFTQTELIESFASSLANSDLLLPEEGDEFLHLTDFVAVFAISKMHGAKMNLAGGREALVLAHVGPDSVETWIGAEFVGFKIMLAHFMPKISVENSCAAEVITVAPGAPFPESLELDERGRLTILR